MATISEVKSALQRLELPTKYYGLAQNKGGMSDLVKEIYMIMLSEESMYSHSTKMAQFMIDREITLRKINEMAKDDE
jgi:hypothetical protein